MINGVQMPLNKIDKQSNLSSILQIKERGDVEKSGGDVPVGLCYYLKIAPRKALFINT